jgi:hypothetical protein
MRDVYTTGTVFFQKVYDMSENDKCFVFSLIMFSVAIVEVLVEWSTNLMPLWSKDG